MRGSQRKGYTIVELTACMVSASILLAGLGGALGVAFRVSSAGIVPSLAIRLAHAGAEDVTRDIAAAVLVPERTSRAITLRVPDRNGDGAIDTVRYQWSGVAGSGLLREYNSSAPAEVVGDVHQLDFQYVSANSRLAAVRVRLQVGSAARGAIYLSAPCLNLP